MKECDNSIRKIHISSNFTYKHLSGIKQCNSLLSAASFSINKNTSFCFIIFPQAYKNIITRFNVSFLQQKTENKKTLKVMLFFSFIQQGQKNISTSCCLQFFFSLITSLTFKKRASYIQDGRTATLQMLHFIYFFQQI